MAIPWAAIGAGLQGVGALASAFGGSKGPSMSKQTEYSLSYAHRYPEMIRYGASKAGFHPLALFGSGQGFSPSVVAGQSRSQYADAVSAAGQVASNVGARKRQEVMDAAAVKESEARAYKATAEGALADQQAGFLNQQANAAALAKEQQMQNGARDKIYRSHVPVRDHFTGAIYYAPNPEIYELPETVGLYEYGRGRSGPNEHPHGPANVAP